MALALAAKATGLLREMVVASQFGTSPQMDAFVVAATISSLIFAWLKNPLQVVLVPLFTRELVSREEAVAWASASLLTNTLVVLFLGFAAAGWLLAPLLTALVAPGLTGETAALAASLSRVMMLALVFLGAAHILSGFCHAYQRFGRPGMLAALENSVVIPAVLVFAPWLGIHGLALAIVVGALAEAVVQTPILWEHRGNYRLGLDFGNPIVRRMGAISLPLLVGTGGAGLGKLADRMFASFLRPGSLSALAYAHQLTFATFHLFVGSLTTVLFPFLSRSVERQDYDEVRIRIFKCLRILFWVVVPLSVGMALLGEPLVRLVFGRGKFGEESVMLTTQAVFFYALGLAGYSLSHVLTFAFYSVQNTRIPVAMGLVRLAAKILLSAVLVRSLGHAGLALAESVSFALKAVLLLLWLPAPLRTAEYPRLIVSFASTVVVTGGMAAIILASRPLVTSVFEMGASVLSTSLGLAAMAAVAGASYLCLSLLLQPVEVKFFLRSVRSGLSGLR